MNLRAVIVGLIVLATVGFVIGVSVERNTEDSHAESPTAASSENTSSESHAEGGEESEASHADEGAEQGEGEFQPFGIDIEALPFIVLAALASLAMAAAVWTRPTSLLVLGIVAIAMLLFAALDVREVFHQADESRTGLAVLAGVVAALHLAAAAAIALLASGGNEPTGRAGTIPA